MLDTFTELAEVPKERVLTIEGEAAKLLVGHRIRFVPLSKFRELGEDKDPKAFHSIPPEAVNIDPLTHGLAHGVGDKVEFVRLNELAGLYEEREVPGYRPVGYLAVLSDDFLDR